MDKYGIDNVRGASYISINLDENIKKVSNDLSTSNNKSLNNDKSLSRFFFGTASKKSFIIFFI